MSKMFKDDPVRNKFAAEEMADRVRDWWHSRGQTKVKVWVEETNGINDFGTKMPSVYEIKSNIIQDVNQVLLGNVIG